MKYMKHKYLLFTVAVLGISALALIFSFTDPVSIGLFGVVAVFAIIYLVTFCLIYAISLIIVSQINKKRDKIRRIQRRKVRYISGVLSLAPVLTMSFFSLGSINLPEIIVVILIETVAIFFINKRF